MQQNASTVAEMNCIVSAVYRILEPNFNAIAHFITYKSTGISLSLSISKTEKKCSNFCSNSSIILLILE